MIGVILLGIFMILFGMGIIAAAIYPIILAIKSQSWPTTLGKVTISEINVITDKERTSYEHLMAYEYELNGSTYASDKLEYRFFKFGGTRSIRKIVDDYPVGREVVVHYDAHDPWTAVLNTAIHKWSYMFIFGGIWVISLGIAYFT
ncbi:MAG: DUF3592 domain-containing protein [Candidatus Heimdallarchaeota archaeon]|nr:DUF3592 domain-containing protein [Candidatus Heimdallarchaeota archaeon]